LQIDGVDRVSTNFANFTFEGFTQAFPSMIPPLGLGATNPARTGAFELDHLGIGGLFGDTTYRFSLTVPHTASTATFNFSSFQTGPALDEGWGLDNVSVYLRPIVGPSSPQRSRVTSLAVTFDMNVNFAGSVADAFTLNRNGGKPVQFTATSSIVGGVTVVTLSNFTGLETQFGSFRDGRYTLTVLSSQISANGQQMTSNYTFGDAQGLFRMFGDINGDRQVDGADFGAFSFTYGSLSNQPNYLWFLDANGDGQIDGFDFSQFSGRFNTILP
jgi:hypothetical protein